MASVHFGKVRYLAGDIGGTNARLSLFELDWETGQDHKVESETYPTDKYSSLEACISDFLGKNNKGYPPPLACSIAIAGPIDEDSTPHDHIAQMTNLNWRISKQSIKAHFKIAHVALINDFVAIGFGLTALTSSEYVVLHEGKKKDKAPIACLGAGTGLGEVYLTNNGSEYDVWSTEGGHTDYAAKNEEEFGFVKYMTEIEKKHRVSVERMVCGTGLPNLYNYLKTLKDYPEDPKIAALLEEKGADKARIISDYGLGRLSPVDKLCQKTMTMFLHNYFAEAGNLALKTLPRGGLFIAGGIAPKILDIILQRKEELLNMLFDKGRMSDLLKTVPVYVVTHGSVGELGSKVVAKRLVLKAKKTGAIPKTPEQKYGPFVIGFAVGAVVASVATAISYLTAKKKST